MNKHPAPVTMGTLVVGMLTTGLLTTAAASAFTMWSVGKRMDQELAMRPPVAIIDVISYALNSPGESASPDAAMADGVERARSDAEELANQGVLVLLPAAVLKAPEGMVLLGGDAK